MRGSPSIEMLKVVARGLGDFKEHVVFLGGATVALHVTDPGAPDLRVTMDVDCVVEITSRKKYYEMEEKLRCLGFKHPVAGEHPICRWEFSGLLVDVMPTDEKILGFSNRWYQEGMAYAESFPLGGGVVIRAFSAPYFLATKLEAFRGRGRNDFLASADLEDIVAIVDGCPELPEKMRRASPHARSFIQRQFKQWLKNKKFIESIDGHIRSANPGTEGDRVTRALRLFEEMTRI